MNNMDERGERGSALVLSLLVLVILSILSMVAANSTIQGLLFSKKFNNRIEALHASDGGARYGYGVVSRAIANGGKIDPSDSSNIDILTDTNTNGIPDIEDEITGLTVDSNLVTPIDSSLTATTDATINVAGDVKVDIDFVRTQRRAGVSSEFASRYQGIGSGSAGGFASYYRIDATGGAGTDSESTVRLHYRCIEGGGRCL